MKENEYNYDQHENRLKLFLILIDKKLSSWQKYQLKNLAESIYKWQENK